LGVKQRLLGRAISGRGLAPGDVVRRNPLGHLDNVSVIAARG